jgi:hypothetical protein
LLVLRVKQTDLAFNKDQAAVLVAECNHLCKFAKNLSMKRVANRAALFL